MTLFVHQCVDCSDDGPYIDVQTGFWYTFISGDIGQANATSSLGWQAATSPLCRLGRQSILTPKRRSPIDRKISSC